MSHYDKWVDFSSGLALLYMGPGGQPDQYTTRIMAAHVAHDLEEFDHVTAVMLALMRYRGQDVQELSAEWGRLDREYHATHCGCRMGESDS